MIQCIDVNIRKQDNMYNSYILKKKQHSIIYNSRLQSIYSIEDINDQGAQLSKPNAQKQILQVSEDKESDYDSGINWDRLSKLSSHQG